MHRDRRPYQGLPGAGGGMGHNCSLGFSGMMNVLELGQSWWLHNVVNLLNATSFAYKQFILCYVNFTSVINQWRAEPQRDGPSLLRDAAVLGFPGVLLLEAAEVVYHCLTPDSPGQECISSFNCSHWLRESLGNAGHF